ncbi:MAG: phosphotransferase family protein [Pseudomonadota bacterium]
MSTRQEQFSGTKEVQAHLSFDTDALARLLGDAINGFEGPITVREFKGGQSNPTYQLVTPSRKYVLRRKPPGNLLPSAHAVDREYRVMHALYGHVPVPETYLLCEDLDVLGTAFYVMEMVEGRIYWDVAVPGVSVEERRAIYDSMATTMAQLHAVDYTAVGLEGFGKTSDYVARQVHRWGKTYVASETQRISSMDKLNAWLPSHIPETDGACVVHGDFRLDNMIIDAKEPKVAAILDWELSTLGHAYGDFASHLAPWLIPSVDERISSIEGLDLPALGIPSEEEYIQKYCNYMGISEIPNMDYYRAYTVWRLGCIYQGIIKRVQDGTAASADAPTNADIVEQLGERAWEYATRAGAT